MSSKPIYIYDTFEFEGRTWLKGTTEPTHDNGVSYEESLYESGCFCSCCSEAFLHR